VRPVGQLVGDEVAGDAFGGQHQPPVEGERPARRAASPPPLLVADDDPPEVEPVVKNAARTTLVLSASAFKGRNHFTSAARTSSFVNQVNFKSAGPVDPGAKKQFRADESEISRTKDVAFVPSKGQKLPE